MNRTSVTTPISSRVDDILNADTTTAAVDQILGREFQGTTMNVEDPGTLSHYGVLGMKWGVRKDRRGSSIGQKLSSGKAKVSSAVTTAKAARAKKKRVATLKKANKAKAQQQKIDKKTNNPKKMSDAELKKRIERLELEKKYKSLNAAQFSEGKKIAQNIISKSAENIGTQLGTYLLGEAVNKAFQEVMKQAGKQTKENIVNPRKGQKDK